MDQINRNQENEFLLPNIISIAHAIVRTVIALDKTVEMLLQKNIFMDINDNQFELDTFHKGVPFYKILQQKESKGDLTLEQAKHILHIILRELDRFRLNTQNYLGSLTKNQQLVIKKTPQKLLPIIEEVTSLFEGSAIYKGIDLRLNIQDDVTLPLDYEHTFRMLANILDNAIKYSYSHSDKAGQRFVLIESRRHSMHNDWIISFQSYGVGIEQNEIVSRRIFEYGYRGKSASDRGRFGTGIGLAEAMRIALAHKGNIEVESKKLDGDTYLTIVKVILPNI